MTVQPGHMTFTHPPDPAKLRRGWAWLPRLRLAWIARSNGHLSAPKPGHDLARSAVSVTAALLGDRPMRVRVAALRDAVAMFSGQIVENHDTTVRQDALIVAAATLASRGVAVHVATLSNSHADELLACHDLAKLRLTAVAIADSATLDERLAAYTANIVFATASRLARDRLRDQVVGVERGAGLRGAVRNLAHRSDVMPFLMPEHRALLVDNADLVMLATLHSVNFASESEPPAGRMLAAQAFEAIQRMLPGVHYVVEAATGRFALTKEGQERLLTYAALFGGPWSDPDWRQETVMSALFVRDKFARGKDYEVENEQVSLSRSHGRHSGGPSIPDLVAAKERLNASPRSLHLWDTRRLISSYGRIGGVGMYLSDYGRELKRIYGLRTKVRRGVVPAPVPPRILSSRSAATDAAAELAPFPDGTILWTPTESEVGIVPTALQGLPLYRGIDILGAPPETPLIVQLGAAHRAWEARLPTRCPNARIAAFVSPEDGVFSSVADHADVTALSRADARTSGYRRAQRRAEAAAADNRMRHVRSEDYFDRILSFIGDTR